VKETIHELSPQYRLILITKGDLFDQEAKLARSGLGIYFDVVEIVVKKDVETYEKLFAKHQIETNEVVMVGNSLRSDILPVVELGGKAVYIPYETEWFHEKVTEEELQGKEFITIKQFAELKDIIWEK
jgi:putative hydrolase of the HAD superfamily